MAGLLSGLGSSFQPQTVSPLSINPGGTTQYQYPSVSSVVGNAVGGGVGNAAGMIAKYYLQQAEQLTPTLQVNPGTAVDIILEQGTEVKKAGMTSAQLTRTSWEAAGQPSGAVTSTPQQQAAQAISQVPGAQQNQGQSHAQ
jgi:hypothetical protein